MWLLDELLLLYVSAGDRLGLSHYIVTEVMRLSMVKGRRLTLGSRYAFKHAYTRRLTMSVSHSAPWTSRTPVPVIARLSTLLRSFSDLFCTKTTFPPPSGQSSTPHTSSHSTQNAFIFNAYMYPANASLNVPSASCISFSLSTLMAKDDASSARSIMAGARKSSPDGEEREVPSWERAREEREPVDMRRRGWGRCDGGMVDDFGRCVCVERCRNGEKV